MNRIWNSVIIPMNQGGSGGRHVHHKQWYLFEQLDTGKEFVFLIQKFKFCFNVIVLLNQVQFTKLP